MSGNFNDVKGTLCGVNGDHQDAQLRFSSATDTVATVSYTLVLDDGWPAGNHALYILEGSCHNELCIDAAAVQGLSGSVTFNAEAGLVYIVDVEAPAGSPDYRVTVTCAD